MRLPLFALCCLLLSNGFARALALPMAETELDMGIPATAPVVDKKPVPLPRRADVFRKEFALKLRKGRAERKDYDDGQKGIETLERPPFISNWPSITGLSTGIRRRDVQERLTMPLAPSASTNCSLKIR